MTAIETLFKRDDAVVLAALVLLALLAWLATLAGAGTGMDPFAMSGWRVPAAPPTPGTAWALSYWLIVFFMWVAAMVAMMLPGAAPMVLLYARVVRKADGDAGAAPVRTAIAAFASGYLAVWSLFSLFAVCLQFGLERIGVMSAMMSVSPARLAGGFLIAAGLYQLTPLKTACLNHCRGSAAFLAAHWRAGLSGAFRMGPWRLLPRLLRRAHAASVRGRRDESRLDRGAHAHRGDREARAVRGRRGEGNWSGADRRQRCAPRRRAVRTSASRTRRRGSAP